MLFNDAKDKVCEIIDRKIKLDDNNLKLHLLEKFERESKFSRKEFLNIWQLRIPTTDLTEVQLCILFKELSSVYKDMGTVKDYFTSVEIQNANNYIYVSEDIGYPIVFKNVRLVNDDQFSVIMSYNQIARLQNSGMLKLNPHTQRETYSIVKNGIRIEYVKTYEDQIDEIKDKILQNRYTPDEIKLNLQKDDECKYEFNEELGELIVYSGNIYKIDGNHRIFAITNAYEIRQDVDLNFDVTLFIKTEIQAQDIIYQQELKRPISKTRVSSLENTSENYLVNKIAYNPDLDISLQGRIIRDRNNIIRSNGLFVMSDMAKAIRAYYDRNDIVRYKEETISWIIKFLNDLSFIMEDKFKDTYITKRNTWALDDVAVFVYIYLSKELQNNDNWRKELESIINKIDFTKSASPLGVYGKKEALAAKKFIEEEILNG